MAIYLNKIIDLRTQLVGCGCNWINDEFMIFIILQSLTSKFSHFVTVVETKLDDEKEVISLESLSRLLLKHEETLNKNMLIPSSKEQSVALGPMKPHFKKKFKNNKRFSSNQDYKKGGNRNHVGRDKSRNSKVKFDGNCNFCGIYGHRDTECYKKKKEQGGKIDGNCNFCGTYGHRESDCFKKKKFQSGKGSDKSNNFNNRNKNKKVGYVAAHYTKSHSNTSEWIIDLGCTNHMCFEKSKFENFY